MTFDRDFVELVESESRLPARLADFNKASDDFVRVRPKRLVAESR